MEPGSPRPLKVCPSKSHQQNSIISDRELRAANVTVPWVICNSGFHAIKFEFLPHRTTHRETSEREKEREREREGGSCCRVLFPSFFVFDNPTQLLWLQAMMHQASRWNQNLFSYTYMSLFHHLLPCWILTPVSIYARTVLQSTAVCCGVFALPHQSYAVCCGMLKGVAVRCSVLQCVRPLSSSHNIGVDNSLHNTPTHPPTHSSTNPPNHSSTQPPTHPHTLSHKHTHTCRNTHVETHTHAHAHIHTHTHTNTHTHARTHIQTHIHA